MRNFVCLLSLGLLFSSYVRAAVAQTTETADALKPNIVFVFADDLGWRDVGFDGNRFIETPNLDALAAQGMTFTSAYATAGNCAPSRACLMSGKYTPRHGVYAVGSTDRGPKALHRLTPIPNHEGLRSEFVTMAESLKAAGYATGHFGKWHLAGAEGALPTEQGFDVSFDSFGDGELREGSEGNKTGPPEDPKGVFALTRMACQFIEEKKDQPFFCYLAHHAIHTPLQGKPDVVAHYKEKPKPGPNAPGAMYAACTTALDESVQILIDKIDALGLKEKTLIVFTSDNGALSIAPQEPLRGSKGGYYEGGIRVPCFVLWPGKIQAGSKSDVPITNVDFYPTFISAAQASVPQDLKLDGENLWPLLQGKSQLKRESIFWHFPGYLNSPVVRGRELDVRTGFRSRPVSVIRKGDWKLHLFHEEWTLDGGQESIGTNHCVELYNLQSDIGERQDLAQSQPEKRDELLGDLLRWMESAEAPMPTEANPKFDRVLFESIDNRNASKGRKRQQK